MIQSTNELEYTFTSNTATLPFTDTDLRTASANCFNGWLNHNEGSPTFNVVAGGIYEISFNTNITSATPGEVSLGLYADGVLLNGTTMTATIAAAGDYENISFNKRVRVCGRGNVTFTIQSIPTTTYDGTPTDTQIPITKNANISFERRFGS